jgi:tetratricopeptide (TPR) repeat protein
MRLTITALCTCAMALQLAHPVAAQRTRAGIPVPDKKQPAAPEQTRKPAHETRAAAADEWTGLTQEVMRLCQVHRWHEAIPVAQQSVQVAKRDFGPDHLHTARSLNNVGYLNTIIGKMAGALPYLKQADAIMQGLSEPDHHEHAILLDNLSRAYIGVRQASMGQQTADRVIEIRTKARGTPYPDWNVIPDITLDTRMLGEVEAMPFTRVLRSEIKMFGPNSEGAANRIHKQGEVMLRWPMYAYAELLFKRALEIRTKVHGPNNPLVANTTWRLASIYDAQGQFEEPERLYKRAIESLSASKGPNAPMVAVYRNSLARLYKTHGRQASANEETLKVGEVMDKRLGRETPDDRKENLKIRRPPQPERADEIQVRNLLVEAKYAKGRGNIPKAEPLYRNGLARQEQLLGPDHVDVGVTHEEMGEMFTKAQRYDEALHHLKKALKIREKHYGPDHDFTMTNLILIAEVYHRQGNDDAYWPVRKRLTAGGVSTISFTSPKGRTLRERGKWWPNVDQASNWYRNWGEYAVHYANKEYNNAVGIARGQVYIAKNNLGAQHKDVALAQERLAECLHLQDAPVQAEKHYQEAIKIRRQAQGANHPAVGKTETGLAELYLAEKKLDAATKWFESAASVLERSQPEHREDLLRAYRGLLQCYTAAGRTADANKVMARMGALGAG